MTSYYLKIEMTYFPILFLNQAELPLVKGLALSEIKVWTKLYNAVTPN